MEALASSSGSTAGAQHSHPQSSLAPFRRPCFRQLGLHPAKATSAPRPNSESPGRRWPATGATQRPPLPVAPSASANLAAPAPNPVQDQEDDALVWGGHAQPSDSVWLLQETGQTGLNMWQSGDAGAATGEDALELQRARLTRQLQYLSDEEALAWAASTRPSIPVILADQSEEELALRVWQDMADELQLGEHLQHSLPSSQQQQQQQHAPLLQPELETALLDEHPQQGAQVSNAAGLADTTDAQGQGHSIAGSTSSTQGVSSIPGGVPGDANLDRIRALVQRYVPTAAAEQAATRAPRSTAAAPAAATSSSPQYVKTRKAKSDQAAAPTKAKAPASKEKSARATATKATSTPSAKLKAGAAASASPAAADSTSTPATTKTARRRVRTAAAGTTTVAETLAQLSLPNDVAAAVEAAIQAGHLPNDAAHLEQLLDRVLEKDLGVGREAVLSALRRCATVFRQSSDSLRDKAARLGDLLGCAPPGTGSGAVTIGRLISLVPSLWGMSPESVRLKVTALGHLLSLPPREVTALARKCPNLLVCNSDSLADKFASLKSLMAVGGIGSKQVVRLVLECPQVLFLNGERLALKFRDLADMLAIPQGELAAMCVSKPLLLTSSADTLRANWEELRACAQLSPRWADELLLPSPASSTASQQPQDGSASPSSSSGLSRSKSKRSRSKTASLQQLSGGSSGPEQPQRREGVSPSTRANWLLASSARTRRLRYLAAANQGDAIALSSVLGMTDAEFKSRYPGYAAWQRAYIGKHLAGAAAVSAE